MNFYEFPEFEHLPEFNIPEFYEQEEPMPSNVSALERLPTDEDIHNLLSAIPSVFSEEKSKKEDPFSKRLLPERDIKNLLSVIPPVFSEEKDDPFKKPLPDATARRRLMEGVPLMNERIFVPSEEQSFKKSKPNPHQVSKGRHGTKWTREETNFLIQNWKNMTPEEVASALGRSIEAVKSKSYELYLYL